MASLSSQTVLLNDGTTATIHPVWDGSQLPLELVASLCVEYNAEIDRGRSFPETQKLILENFEKSWFSGVAGVMIKGDDESQSLLEDFDLLDSHECYGSFWIQPCFPGRSSHICTANLLVKHRFRNHGVGTAMAQCFLRWALQLGYDYALFNLVYDSNIAACRLLQRLGFRVLTVLRGAGILKGFDRPVDAFVFGRSLLPRSAQTPATPSGHPSAHSGSTSGYTPAVSAAPSGSSVVSRSPVPHVDGASGAPLSTPASVSMSMEPGPMPQSRTGLTGQLSEEYENIRTYLTTGEYPVDSSRVERTRIRSRARTYTVEDGVLLFKRTRAPVISDEEEQMRIVTEIHRENHNGINKLQKRILGEYYWNGVRDTIVKVIKNCAECRASSHSRGGPLEPVDAIDSALPTDNPAEPTSPHAEVSMDSYYDPQDPGSIVYLPPENEDAEYVPEEDVDLDLGLDYEDDDDDWGDDEVEES